MPLFTRENARQAAIRGNLVRWSRPRPPQPPPEPPAIPAIIPPSIAEPLRDFYSAQALIRTRLQLDLCAQSILDELNKHRPDSRRLRDLSDAQAKLAEQERILAGRPLPGSRRPAQDRAPRSDAGAWSAEPLDVPAQVTDSQPAPPSPAGPAQPQA